MGNEYSRFNHYHQHHHHHHHHHVHAQLHINHRGTFLPMLCSRPSIKDVQVPSSLVSPRIGCMGQVKRSNKVSGYPVTSTQSNNSSNNIKYSKLKKLFSGKNFTPFTPTKTTTATATATSCPISRCRSRRPQVSTNVRQGHCVVKTINLAEMDPPLPVIKRVQRSPQQGEESTLYKRRSGGAALQGLQLKQVHLPRLQTQSKSV
ncbi:hypothetical protein ACLB2K_051004 [Fragaria x ananassa]